MIPEFAILGHPNEGKSSVLSTLAEDDSVRISPTPGETTACRAFPVKIDGKEILRFTDTPGFQNPSKMLSILKAYKNDRDNDILQRFHNEYNSDSSMHHDCELLRPLLRGAGIIYVADGSRPVRNVDLAEMEILRLSGKPRMAVLNCKEGSQTHLDSWKNEFRKNFNSSRIFNAHSATYIERIRLLEALKSIEQDWQAPLDYVVTTFQKDWQARNLRTTNIINDMVTACIQLQLKKNLRHDQEPESEKERLYQKYTKTIRDIETKNHQQIRKIYKHNIFNLELPPQSILQEDLFAEETWNFLGLQKKQLALAGGAGGAALAAGLDIAAGGASLGFFTSLGGIIGALGAVYGSKSMSSKINIMGIGPGNLQLQIGPNENPQFPFILIDRALIFYSSSINWAHGRRDYDTISCLPAKGGYSRLLEGQSVKVLGKYFRLLQNRDSQAEEYQQIFTDIISELLHNISTSGTDENNNQN